MASFVLLNPIKLGQSPMIYSMTGYGEATAELNGKTYHIEVRSLNGKNSDIRFRSTNNLKDKEIALRKLIMTLGMRGKFDVNLSIISAAGLEENQINRNAMDSYYSELKDFNEAHGLDSGDILQTLIRLPNVVQVGDDKLTDEQWALIESMAKKAMAGLNDFRRSEGESLTDDLKSCLENINTALEKVKTLNPERVETVKERIKKNLAQHMGDESIDENRFEQELLFYVEKLDINEEMVRLEQHCKYFLSELEGEHIQKGKKLNFIGQEIGREINTLGAKAQHSEVQQLVVSMKDQLEKIKEQVLNIL